MTLSNHTVQLWRYINSNRSPKYGLGVLAAMDGAKRTALSVLSEVDEFQLDAR